MIISCIDESGQFLPTSPYTPMKDYQDAKRLPFNQAEFGGVGLETLLTLTLTLVKNKKITLPHAIKLLTKNPSKILKLDSGIIKKKIEADLCIFDISKPWKINPDEFNGKSKMMPTLVSAAQISRGSKTIVI